MGGKTMTQGLAELDALVREEKRLTALETQTDAWAEGLSAGIEPELIAEVALVDRVSGACTQQRRNAAVSLIDRMRERIVSGEFAEDQRRH
jgi:hypothetical protein